ncbi:MAG TPA: hypothetical protein PKI61_02625 [bacterium]|nr:hypothetical protein [bacterium]HPT29747.1 hypothetical protein [bacterium]
MVYAKQKKKIAVICLFLLAFIFCQAPTANAAITGDDQVDCPTATATEVLVYFHGLLAPTYTDNGPQWTLQESINTFYSELNKIRAVRPGVAAGHFNYTTSAQTAINAVKSQCNITGQVPVVLAAHSAGGKQIRPAGALADKLILIDAVYWDPSALFSYCSKIRIIDGSSTQENTPALVSNCQSDASFKYVDNRTSSINHFAARSYLSSFYLDSTPVAGGGAQAAAAAPEKPFVVNNPLENLQVVIPGLDKIIANNPATCTTTDGKTTCSLPWIAQYIKGIYNYALAIIGVIAAIALMIGGVLWLVSAGNASRISTAQNWIAGSLTGILIMMTSYILLNEINPDLIGLKPVTLKIIEEIMPDTTDALSIANPSLDPSTWVPIPSNPTICPNAVRANQPIVDKIIAATDCMAAKGLMIEIGGGSRTVLRQAEIYDERYNHPANQCNKAGLKPGYAIACCPYPLGEKICPHNSGSAFDIRAVTVCGITQKDLSNQYILQDCMQAAGAYLLDAECWHFESPQISPYSKSQVGNHNDNYCKDWPK